MKVTRFVSLLTWTLACAAALPGCSWIRKPYADDPLLRRRPSSKEERGIGSPGDAVPRPTPPAPPDESP